MLLKQKNLSLSVVFFIFFLAVCQPLVAAVYSPVQMLTSPDNELIVAGQDLLGMIVVNGDTVGTSPYLSGGFLMKMDTAGQVIWKKYFPNMTSLTSFSEFPNTPGLVVDSMGNIYLASTYSGKIKFSPSDSLTGSGSLFLAKFDKNGNFFWAIETEGNDNISRVELAIGKDQQLYLGARKIGSPLGFNGLPSVTGNASFIAKINPGGVPLWINSFPGPSTFISSISVSDASVVRVLGQFKNSAPLTFGSFQIPESLVYTAFVAEIDPSGQPGGLESITFGGELLPSDILDMNSAYLVTGVFGDSADLGNTSSQPGILGPPYDLFLASYDSQNDSLLWMKSAKNDAISLRIKQDDQNLLMLADLADSTFSNQSTGWHFLKMTLEGDAICSQPWLYGPEEGPGAIATDAAKNVYVLGGSGQPFGLLGGTDFYLVKYDSLCNQLWDLHIPHLSPNVSIEEDLAFGQIFSLFPNPATDRISLKADVTASLKASYAIYSKLGSRLQLGELSFSPTQNQAELSLENFKPGIYLLSVRTESGVNTFRFLKE